MARTPERPIPQPQPPAALTRRGFIKTACVSAAAAAALEGCAKQARGPAGAMLAGARDAPPKAAQRPGLAKAPAHHTEPKRPTSVVVVSDAQALTCDDDGALIRWDIRREGAATKLETFRKHHAGKASYLALHPKRDKVLTSGFDGSVIVHDLGAPQNEAPPAFAGHRADGKGREVWVVAVCRSGQYAMSATNDGQILFWEVANPGGGYVTFKFSDAAVAGLAFVSQVAGGPETHFLSTHSRGTINLWDLRPVLAAIKQNHDEAFKPGNLVLTQPVQSFLHGNRKYVNAVAVTESGTRFLSAGFDNTVRAFDLPTPLPAPLAGLGVADAKTAPAPAPPARHAAAEGAPAGAPADIHIPGGPGHAPEPPGPAPIVQHGANVWRLATKGATIAASSSQDGTVVVFDHHKRTHLMTFNTLSKEKGHNVVGGAMGVAFTPDGRIVYTGISDEQAPLESRPVQVRPA